MTEVRHDPSEPARRDDHPGEGATRGTARMEAFADGVFAIAFTLPVVHIAFPEIESEGSRLGGQLVALWPAYLGYAQASLVIGLFWVHHHFSGAIYRTTGHWFLLATVVFLATIGFIAFPARVFSEHFADATARPAAARYWVISMAALSLAWLFKWTVGLRRGQVDSRLDPDYVRRLDRGYWSLGLLGALAAILVFIRWELGLALSTAVTLYYLRPPETPQYFTESPIVEGES